jgi:hypothetical protein
MGKRLDALVPRDKHNEPGTWFHKIGHAWVNDKGTITVYLDSLPIPDHKDGQVRFLLLEPLPPKQVAPNGPSIDTSQSYAEALNDRVKY